MTVGLPNEAPPEDANTNRLTPASAAARITLTPPTMLIEASCTGSTTLARASIWAAMWNTTSG